MCAGALPAARWTDSPHQNTLLVQGVLVKLTGISAWSRVENKAAFCVQLVVESWCVINTEYEGNSHFELKIPACTGIPLVQSHAPLGKQVKQWSFCCQMDQGDPTGAFLWSLQQVWGLVYHACSSPSKSQRWSVQQQCPLAVFLSFSENTVQQEEWFAAPIWRKVVARKDFRFCRSGGCLWGIFVVKTGGFSPSKSQVPLSEEEGWLMRIPVLLWMWAASCTTPALWVRQGGTRAAVQTMLLPGRFLCFTAAFPSLLWALKLLHRSQYHCCLSACSKFWIKVCI